jgi:hypothetical protein
MECFTEANRNQLRLLMGQTTVSQTRITKSIMKSIQDPNTNEPSLGDYVFSITGECAQGECAQAATGDIDWREGAHVPESVEETID